MASPRQTSDIQAEIDALNRQLGSFKKVPVRSYRPGLIPGGYGSQSQWETSGSRYRATDQPRVDELSRQLKALQAELGTATEYYSPQNQAIREYDTAYNEAKEANEKRYEEMLDIADRTTDQRAADIRTDYASGKSAAQQDLSRRGLGNTTIAPTISTRYDREMQSALNRNADEMQQTRLDIMERRTDAYPDRGMLMEILRQYGLGTGQVGGGSSGGVMGPISTSYRVGGQTARKPSTWGNVSEHTRMLRDSLERRRTGGR